MPGKRSSLVVGAPPRFDPAITRSFPAVPAQSALDSVSQYYVKAHSVILQQSSTNVPSHSGHIKPSQIVPPQVLNVGFQCYRLYPGKAPCFHKLLWTSALWNWETPHQASIAVCPSEAKCANMQRCWSAISVYGSSFVAWGNSRIIVAQSLRPDEELIGWARVCRALQILNHMQSLL